MLINKRLISTVPKSKKYIFGNVILQWCSLLSNIIMILSITGFLEKLYLGNSSGFDLLLTTMMILSAIIIRGLAVIYSSKLSFLSSKAVKKILREQIYKKLLSLGSAYKMKISTAQILQLAVEGVEQLETYFGSYLPQFFYSLLAPLTLFFVLSFISLPAALILLFCVPLIPITIAGVQTVAKKLLARYWEKYTTLGDHFLENLEGLITLKIYQSDQHKNEEMNRDAENFRTITMKVLTMQLNSVTIMDLIAYGGAALGIIMAITEFQSGSVSLSGCLTIILISADFFIPMRMLGSFFHIAMNGMAASDKIFALLDLPSEMTSTITSFPTDTRIACENLCFSYDHSREILRQVNCVIPQIGLTAIVGESGCGKSTLASLLIGRNKQNSGQIRISNQKIEDISEFCLLENITYVGFDSFLFKGTVRENLLISKTNASDMELWDVLTQMNLSQFLKAEKGLDTLIAEKASNLSGGQRQRLCLARALLHNSPIYIFDEATSNIDIESENHILSQIYKLSKNKTVIMITHRLANALPADIIYVMEKGRIAESGTHHLLLSQGGLYAKLYHTQHELEHFKETAIS